MKLLLIAFLFSANMYSQSAKLIGTWTIFWTDEKVSSLDCKTCPTWEFKPDHTMVFTKPNGEQFTTTWTMDKDMLSIGKVFRSAKGEETENKMPEAKLKCVFTDTANFNELRFIVNNQTRPMVIRKKK